MDKKTEKIVLTGDRPTGKLHLGHYVGSIQKRVELQEKYRSFYMIADLQALTDNADNPAKVHDAVFDVALDNLAAGLDPEKTTMFAQSQIREIPELAFYFFNLVTLARVRRNPTVKDEMRQKGYGENVPVGFLLYPISQAADILFSRANTVPVGEDQLPVIEQANEIVSKFNALYGETFEHIEAVLSEASRLPGIFGKEKMSKSLNNAIFLSDSADEIERKVMQMYTDPEHIRSGDPGKVEGNVVFAFLDIFDPDKEKLAELKVHYAKGGVGDVAVKKRLTAILQNTLAPIRKRRTDLENDPDLVRDILRTGTAKAREVAGETMEAVRAAMRLTY